MSGGGAFPSSCRLYGVLRCAEFERTNCVCSIHLYINDVDCQTDGLAPLACLNRSGNEPRHLAAIAARKTCTSSSTSTTNAASPWTVSQHTTPIDCIDPDGSPPQMIISPSQQYLRPSNRSHVSTSESTDCAETIHSCTGDEASSTHVEMISVTRCF
jgi:hypothetical protein